jgi:hypothetical protein
MVFLPQSASSVPCATFLFTGVLTDPLVEFLIYSDSIDYDDYISLVFAYR